MALYTIEAVANMLLIALPRHFRGEPDSRCFFEKIGFILAVICKNDIGIIGI
ncbi:hypothetical protein [Nitrosomonas sp.]|uniref:hypothetical protein n=1 Tax=Nitrosomonas sp. TaxID=42353 RepID=UPI001D9D0795|nr:hypothetical protein [Nitrosomonas sp.]MCB1950045.1 hypothetical protein [Nitrosomonas sp.]